LRARIRVMRGDRGNHHGKIEHQKIASVRPFITSDLAGTSTCPACNNPYILCSQLNQASRTPDFSYPLVSATSFSSLFSISLFVIHNSTNIAEYKVMSSHSISPCHDHELRLGTASTQVCLSSLDSHHYELTPECSYRSRPCSLHDQLPSDSSPSELKANVTVSHSTIAR
jgi:hypothetical protein